MPPVRREGQTQESLLAAERNLIREIQYGHGIHAAVTNRDDPPRLLRDVERRVSGSHGHGERLLERRHFHQTDAYAGERGRR